MGIDASASNACAASVFTLDDTVSSSSPVYIGFTPLNLPRLKDPQDNGSEDSNPTVFETPKANKTKRRSSGQRDTSSATAPKRQKRNVKSVKKSRHEGEGGTLPDANRTESLPRPSDVESSITGNPNTSSNSLIDGIPPFESAISRTYRDELTPAQPQARGVSMVDFAVQQEQGFDLASARERTPTTAVQTLSIGSHRQVSSPDYGGDDNFFEEFVNNDFHLPDPGTTAGSFHHNGESLPDNMGEICSPFRRTQSFDDMASPFFISPISKRACLTNDGNLQQDRFLTTCENEESHFFRTIPRTSLIHFPSSSDASVPSLPLVRSPLEADLSAHSTNLQHDNTNITVCDGSTFGDDFGDSFDEVAGDNEMVGLADKASTNTNHGASHITASTPNMRSLEERQMRKHGEHPDSFVITTPSLPLFLPNMALQTPQASESYDTSPFSSPATRTLSSVASKGPHGLVPFMRPAFPKLVLDRSPILGLSPNGHLLTQFRLGAAINQAATDSRTINSRPTLVELYARVISSHRDGPRQHFVFGDLFRPDKPPVLPGTWVGWKGVSYWELDGSAFLGPQGNERVCRVVGHIERGEGRRFRMCVLSVWEADWDDIEAVKTIICA